MILDGNLTPSLHTNNGDPRVVLSSALRFGTDQGTPEALDEFLGRCGSVGPAKCAFSTGDAPGTRAKFKALLQRLDRARATINDVTLTHALFLKILEGRFFTTQPEPGRFPGWIGAGTLLDAVSKAAAASDAPAPEAAAAASSVQTSPAPGMEEKYVSRRRTRTRSACPESWRGRAC